MRFEECEGLVESLAVAMDGWLAEGFDPDLDIIPTLKRQTVHKRVKPIYDFVQARFLTDDMRKTHDARLARAEKAAAKAAGVATPSVARRGERGQAGDFKPSAVMRANRIAALQRFLADFDRAEAVSDASGLESWRFELPSAQRHVSGDWLLDEFRPIAAVKRAELQQLLAEAENGGGDGKAG